MALALVCALFGPIWLATGYLAEVLPYHAPLPQLLAPLLQPAGMQWSLSLLLWIGGYIALILAFLSMRPMRLSTAQIYSLQTLRWPIVLNLCAAFCFFVTQILINWPFAGFPPGVEEERAVMAIYRHASRAYFMGFCQGGALGLAVLGFLKSELGREHFFMAVRWLAGWAVAGCMPHIMVTWGASIGVGLRSSAAFAQSLWPQTLALTALTIALGCWAFLLWKPQYCRILGICGFGLLLARTALPALLHFFSPA